MRMLFKQRMFSWFDSYDIYNEQGTPLFQVKGQLAWGHRLNIFSPDGGHIATVQQAVFAFLPRFDLYLGNDLIGCLKKQLSFFKPLYTVDALGWTAQGDIFGWNYSITDSRGVEVASVTKELFNWTDTYIIDVIDERDALAALMFVLAVDAEKCSNDK